MRPHMRMPPVLLKDRRCFLSNKKFCSIFLEKSWLLDTSCAIIKTRGTNNLFCISIDLFGDKMGIMGNPTSLFWCGRKSAEKPSGGFCSLSAPATRKGPALFRASSPGRIARISYNKTERPVKQLYKVLSPALFRTLSAQPWRRKKKLLGYPKHRFFLSATEGWQKENPSW